METFVYVYTTSCFCFKIFLSAGIIYSLFERKLFHGIVRLQVRRSVLIAVETSFEAKMIPLNLCNFATVQVLPTMPGNGQLMIANENVANTDCHNRQPGQAHCLPFMYIGNTRSPATGICVH